MRDAYYGSQCAAHLQSGIVIGHHDRRYAEDISFCPPDQSWALVSDANQRHHANGGIGKLRKSTNIPFNLLFNLCISRGNFRSAFCGGGSLPKLVYLPLAVCCYVGQPSSARIVTCELASLQV
jgi:hypothetical protein